MNILGPIAASAASIFMAGLNVWTIIWNGGGTLNYISTGFSGVVSVILLVVAYDKHIEQKKALK